MIPPFCPNSACSLHQKVPSEGSTQWWKANGFHKTKVVGRVRRFQCRTCGKTFSTRTFQLDYYTKKTVDYRAIFFKNTSAECVNAVARNLELRPEVVLNRIERLARNCLAMHHSLEGKRPLLEDLCADGFESFDRSQYFPNHIAILVGDESQQLYSFAHATIRKKGKMTKRQKRVREELEKQYRAPRGGVKASFAKATEVITGKWDSSKHPKLYLTTDEHQAYPRALASLPFAKSPDFTHRKVSSKLSRTKDNPLFPVNYMDREFRKDHAEHHRESTCFVRNVANGLTRLAMYQCWHNYWKSHRINSKKEREPVHAVVSGIDEREVEDAKSRLFVERAFLSRTPLPEWALDVWLRRSKTPLKEKPEYLPAFALA